jgi:[ribosomal protein S18]-alanine N-acetyltransferase
MSGSILYNMRPMEERDLDQVLAIDKGCFPAERNMPPYKNDLLYNEMAHYLVACEGNQTNSPIVGMIGFWMMVGEAHIITIAVRRTHRRRGIGDLLLRSALELAKSLEAFAMTLEVRRSNMEAQSLYAKHGFTERGFRKNYYDEVKEDAVIMTREVE